MSDEALSRCGVEDQRVPWNRVHFIGIGGVGMRGIAHVLLDWGVTVSGSDKKETAALADLLVHGAVLYSGHSKEHLDSPDVVVYSSAVSSDNPELYEAKTRGMRALSRGEFLAELARLFDTVIGVAGSHGKTTTTAMLVYVLRQVGWRPGYMIGGHITGQMRNGSAGNGKILVTEVDESDGTQALLRSSVGVIINIEDDHAWRLGGEKELDACFRRFASNADQVFCWRSSKTAEVLQEHENLCFVSEQEIPDELRCNVTGSHNCINGTLAAKVLQRFGIPERESIRQLQNFPGTDRRMTERYVSPDRNAIVVEDYAHHPTELAVTVEALRSKYPAYRLVMLFQPHRYERVRRYGDQFAELLDQTDEAWILPPFAAWMNNEEAANAETIAEKVKQVPCGYWDGQFDGLAEKVADSHWGQQDSVLYAVIGAGDITELVAPLRKHFVERNLAAVKRQLQERLPASHVETNKPWHTLTSVRAGSACPLLFEPASINELKEGLRILNESGCRVYPLGNGTNTIGSDTPSDIAVVRLNRGEFVNIEEYDNFMECGAGVALRGLIDSLLKRGILRFELAPLAWIPATLGGAVRMNAGTPEATMGSYVASVQGITLDGEEWYASGNDIEWRYRETSIPADVFITQVTLQDFGSSHGDSTAAKQAYERSREDRRLRHPEGPSAGSVFKNAGNTAAGRVLEKSGCKGLHHGGCEISELHANFIISQKGASAQNFLLTALQAQYRVFDYTGVRLVPEVIFVDRDSRDKFSSNVAPLHIAVLKGGISEEREVSLKSGGAIAQALREGGHEVSEVDITEAALPDLSPVPDVVFPALHGTFGEDGEIQALLDEREIPYVGTPAEASRLIMDKAATKKVLLDNDIPTPWFTEVNDPGVDIPEASRFPLVIKPSNQGSTVGMTRMWRPSGWWRRGLKKAFAVDTMALAESYVQGTEVTVSVIDGRAMPAIEIIPPGNRMFDYDAKYTHKRGHTEYNCPPCRVDPGAVETARHIAEKVFSLLGAKDLLRVDFIVDADGKPWVLEANSIPGFTATSLVPKSADVAGISFVELCCGLVKQQIAATDAPALGGEEPV